MIFGAVFVSMLLALGLVSFYYWYNNTYYVSTEDAYIDAEMVKVSPQVAGKILEMFAEEGDRVEAGQMLARQDDVNLPAGSNIDLAVIRSPISGTVIKKLARPGEVGSPGVPVYMVADLDGVYVTANVEEKRIAKVKIGQKVEFTVDGVPGKKFYGTVSEIGQAAASVFSVIPTRSTAGSFTKLTQRIPVKVAIQEKGNARLLPGMNAAVRIHVR